jgi:hypothetical protein
MDDLHAIAGQLQRVKRLFSDWETWECAERMPVDSRPNVARPPVARDDLRQLRADLLGAIIDLEGGWERTNCRAGASYRITRFSRKRVCPICGRGNRPLDPSSQTTIHTTTPVDIRGR